MQDEVTADVVISIHSSRAGGDRRHVLQRRLLGLISIHSSRAGGDPVLLLHGCEALHFNPLLPCGRRRGRVGAAIPGDHISIHSSRAGGDLALIHGVSFIF